MATTPTNEQTNGILRRPLPKHTNLNINPIKLAITEDSNQQHAQKTPPLKHSPNHIQSTMLQPPLELAKLGLCCFSGCVFMLIDMG